jgi:hypothetical protein
MSHLFSGAALMDAFKLTCDVSTLSGAPWLALADHQQRAQTSHLSQMNLAVEASVVISQVASHLPMTHRSPTAASLKGEGC